MQFQVADVEEDRAVDAYGEIADTEPCSVGIARPVSRAGVVGHGAPYVVLKLCLDIDFPDE